MDLIKCGNCGAPLSRAEVTRCEYCHYLSQGPAAPVERTGPRLDEAVSIQATPDFGVDLLAKGTVLPTTRTEMLTTNRDDQDSLTVTLRAGNSSRPADNRLLGTFSVPLQKRGPRSTVSAGLTLHVEADGSMTVTVKEQGVDSPQVRKGFRLDTSAA